MDKLVMKRGVTRAGFTRTAKTLREELKKDPIGKEVISSLFVNLDSKDKELEILNREILDLMIEEKAKEEALVKDAETADQYRNDFLLLKEYVNNFKESKYKDADSVSVNSLNSKCKYKLPKIEWKKFGGDLRDWLRFWSQFKKVDEDSDLDDADKFQYLIQATVSGSRAREVVDSFPPTAGNYRKAVTCLKNRFGRDELLVEVYIRELIALVLSKALCPERADLSNLYDKLETNIRALETLGVTTEKCAALLYPLVESSLREDILRAWQRSSFWNQVGLSNNVESKVVDSDLSSSFCDSKARLVQLMSFLRKEVEGEERIRLATAGFGLPIGNSEGKTLKKPSYQSALFLLFFPTT